MQKIIVTSSEFTGYSTIFSVDGDCIDLHGDDDITDDEFVDLCLAVLPFEIRFEIFEKVILNLIKAGLIRYHSR